MGKPAARLTDRTACPMVAPGPVPHVGGPIVGPCAPNVLIGGLPAARVSDIAQCVGPPDVIVDGSKSVLICGLPAARMFDPTAHGGRIVQGLPTVLIGDKSSGGAGAALASGAGMPAASQAQALIDAASAGRAFVERCR